MRKYFRYTEEELIEEFNTPDPSFDEIRAHSMNLFESYTTIVSIPNNDKNKRKLNLLQQKYGFFYIISKFEYFNHEIEIRTRTPELMTLILLETEFTT